MRPNEFQVLTNDNFDFDNKLLTVEKALTTRIAEGFELTEDTDIIPTEKYIGYPKQNRPDLLIIMLGSNDLKIKFSLPPADIVGSLITMIMKIKGYCDHYLACPYMKILIISPPALSEPFAESYFVSFFGKDDSVARSKELAEWYKLVANEHDCCFLNATEQVEAGSVDHLHLDPEGHVRMVQLVKDKINEIFAS